MLMCRINDETSRSTVRRPIVLFQRWNLLYHGVVATKILRVSVLAASTTIPYRPIDVCRLPGDT